MATSNIEWTDDTWNPTVGCTKVSAGCKHCYAETMHARLTKMQPQKYGDAFTVVKPYPPHLSVPLRAKRPRRYFVNSMSDLFHDDVPDEYIAAVFGVMAATPQHTYQILTKRGDRAARWFEWLESAAADHGYPHLAHCIDLATQAGAWSMPYVTEEIRQRITRDEWPLPNVWLGVSIENQDYADRMLDLVRLPAAVRFISCEPLIAPLALGLLGTLPKDLGLGYRGFYEFIHWVIVGGESGPGARPCALEWIERIVAECKEVDVPVFVKQLGACVVSEERTCPAESMAVLTGGKIRDYDGYRAPSGEVWAWRAGLADKKGGDPSEWPVDLRVRQWPEARP